MKDALKTLLSTVPGVKSVWRGMPKNVPQTLQPAVVVFTPKADEDRVTAMAGRGRRKVTYTARLAVIYIDPTPDAEAGSLAYDDLIDAIEKTIRENPMFVAGSEYPIAGLSFIRTNVEEAKEAGKTDGAVWRMARVEFDIVDFVEG
jgi:hypothetical protein